MEYNFKDIEKKWQYAWRHDNVYKIDEIPDKKPFYVLDMFPYPSGAGLHVGHPLGYIASDIYSRFKRLQGYNVLHPMGYDAFGLPAEQYAIQTGQHPEITTKNNTDRYREQLDKIGFSYDWSREFKTSDPQYYHWTQWTFIKLFQHYYDVKENKAKPISVLEEYFSKNGNKNTTAFASNNVDLFTSQQWNGFDEKQKQEILMEYRLAFLGETNVNWCPKLGTVLANDEVSGGVSIRGGHEVVQRKMKQWCLRVSAYAERLLSGLNDLQWSDSLKETQKNWIGKSEGAEIDFDIKNHNEKIKIFTTRPDTIYGATFMVIAPESNLVELVTTKDNKENVANYVEKTKKKTERERISEKSVSGVFTGGYAINPVNGEELPIYIADYVLDGYGTGAIMAVPAHDSRDFLFAKTFNINIKQVVSTCVEDINTDPNSWDSSMDSKEGFMINSGILNGLSVEDATKEIKKIITDKGLGKVKVNYKLRDATFSRQRYWGEPIPIYYKDGVAMPLDESQLPLLLPNIDKFTPTETGEPPLARAKNWVTKDGYPLETSTMPGFAGSSAYYLRYMDPRNDKELLSREKGLYWNNVNLYIGGTEHATGHLIYSRFWNKFLFDIGISYNEEPFQKLVNQGMIQGRSNFVYRINGTNTFVSLNLKDQYDTTPIHVDVNIVDNDRLDIEKFKKWRPEYNDADFITENGEYVCGWAVEKMSKSMYNVVNPDTIIENYGADTLRLYEMFLGPLEQSKPWDTKGIDGVYKFLRKLWALFFDNDGNVLVEDVEPQKDDLKTINKLIKKVTHDIENFSFNTSVSQFMISVNEFNQRGTKSLSVLKDLIILLSPFAPHISEEIWHKLGYENYIVYEKWPVFDEKYLIDETINYPISFNGKTRFTMELDANLSKDEIEKIVLSNENTKKWIGDSVPKKIIVVPKRIVNIVL